MFSNNNKISSRQIKRLLIFDLFGAASLLLPAQLAKSGNGAGVWSIIAGMVLAACYLWLLLACCDQAPRDYLEFLKSGWGNFLSRVFYGCYAVISVGACAWAAKLLTELMCDSLLSSRDFTAALFVIMVLAFYGGIAGLEARARVYEIMFWVLVIPLVIMLLLCVRQVQAFEWFPMSVSADRNGWTWFAGGTLQSFAAFLPLTFLLFLIPHVTDKKKTGRAAYWAVAVSGAAVVVIYLILLGIFGNGALAAEDYPVVTLMGMVKIPGDFVKRLDAVMVGVWFFTLYALIGSSLYYGADTVRMAFGKKQQGTGGRKSKKGIKRWFLAVTVAVYGAAYGFHIWPDVQAALYEIFYLAGIPFLAAVPAGTLILNKVRKGTAAQPAQR